MAPRGESWNQAFAGPGTLRTFAQTIQSFPIYKVTVDRPAVVEQNSSLSRLTGPAGATDADYGHKTPIGGTNTSAPRVQLRRLAHADRD